MKPFHYLITTNNLAHTSAPVDTRWAANLALDIVWTTAGGTGTVTIEYTPDVEISETTVWRTLDVATIGTDTSPKQLRYTSNYYHNIRAKLVVSTGTITTLKVEAFGKGL